MVDMNVNNKSTTIEFVSDTDFFEKEETGVKPNTVRWLNEEKKATIKRMPPKHITIRDRFNRHRFTRKLTDISELNNGMFIFSWRHKNDHR